MLNFGPSQVCTLISKYQKAVKGVKETKESFMGLDAGIKGELRREWEAQEEKAILHRGEALAIYEVQLQKGALFAFCLMRNSDVITP